MPCFMLRYMFVHAYMLRSTCLGFYAMFPLFCSSFCFILKLGLYAHMLDIMSMVMLCLDLLFICFLHCFMLRSVSIHSYMLESMFYHAYELAFTCSTHVLLCLCLDLRFHRFVCLDLCSACCHLPCAIVALLSLYLSFLYFGLLVWTRSRPGGLCHRPCPWPTSKSLDHPYLHVYACLFLCVTLVLVSLVLGFAMFDTHSGFVVV